MTRKHYRELVRLIAKHNLPAEFTHDLADFLQKDNPRFDRQTFIFAIIDLQLNERLEAHKVS